MKRKISVLYFICLLVAISCHSVDVEKAKGNSWKNNDGVWISDVIVFGNNRTAGFYLDTDLKVFHNGKFVGTVIEVNSTKMVILTPKHEKSYYINF